MPWNINNFTFPIFFLTKRILYSLSGNAKPETLACWPDVWSLWKPLHLPPPPPPGLGQRWGWTEGGLPEVPACGPWRLSAVGHWGQPHVWWSQSLSRPPARQSHAKGSLYYVLTAIVQIFALPIEMSEGTCTCDIIRIQRLFWWKQHINDSYWH